MSDIFLWFLLVAAFTVAWIEWIPERYGIFAQLLLSLVVVTIGLGWIPEWYGWIVLLMGIAELVWIYFSPKRRREWPNLFSAPAKVLGKCFVAVKSAGTSVARRVGERKPIGRTDLPLKKTKFLTVARMRNAIGAICAVGLSPVAALPSVFVLSVLLVAWEAFFGNAPQLTDDFQEATKQVLGRSYVTIIAAADLFSRYLWIAGPLLFMGGYAITAYAIGSGNFWRRYSSGLLLFGTVYPTAFIAAGVFHWHDGPLFN